MPPAEPSTPCRGSQSEWPFRLIWEGAPRSRRMGPRARSGFLSRHKSDETYPGALGSNFPVLSSPPSPSSLPTFSSSSSDPPPTIPHRVKNIWPASQCSTTSGPPNLRPGLALSEYKNGVAWILHRVDRHSQEGWAPYWFGQFHADLSIHPDPNTLGS